MSGRQFQVLISSASIIHNNTGNAYMIDWQEEVLTQSDTQRCHCSSPY